MSFDVVLFDLDGTLIDSVADVTAALNRTFAPLGRPPLPVELVKTLVGGGARPMLEKALLATGGPLDDVDGLIRSYLGHYRAHPADHTIVFPGVVAALETLRAEGMRLAICSNKPYEMCVVVLEALGLARYFDAVTGGDNVPRRKPNPDHCLETLRRMNADGARAVMVGDSEPDVDSARAAGMKVVVVDFGYAKTPVRQLGADAVIGCFEQLPSVLHGLG